MPQTNKLHSGPNLHEGLKDRSPKGDGHEHHGTRPGGHSVDNETTRDSTAETPATLGPRRI